MVLDITEPARKYDAEYPQKGTSKSLQRMELKVNLFWCKTIPKFMLKRSLQNLHRNGHYSHASNFKLNKI